MKHLKFIVLAWAVVQSSLSAQIPTITNPPAGRALWAGGNVLFSVGVSGPGPFSYTWLHNGTNLPDGIITTVAGNGSQAYGGDGSNATTASIFDPAGIAVDAAGNLFIADTRNHRIRKVDTNGIMTTVAGNGITNGPYAAGTFSGDGGPATNAGISFPGGVFVDPAGNLFIADSGNNRVRKVGTNGIITTVAGIGTNAYSGDGGYATNAALNSPSSVVMDTNGNLFIADNANNRVRKVGTNGIITLFAGNGITGFGGIAVYSGDGGQATNAGLGAIALAFDTKGNLFVVDYSNNRVRKIGTNGIITTVAGKGGSDSFGSPNYAGDGGPATNATLAGPSGVALDGLGQFFIADYYNVALRLVNTNGIISTFAGIQLNQAAPLGDGGPATAAWVEPDGVALDQYHNVFIADLQCRIRKVTNTRGPVLALNAVSPQNSGSYQVVVTGPGGSVTSSVVTLTVSASPIITKGVRNNDGSFALSCLSRPGSTNVLSYTASTTQPASWLPLSTNIAGPDGTWRFTDTNSSSTGVRLYRFVSF